MYKEYRATYLPDNSWKISFNVALVFHVLLGLAIVFLPGLFQFKHKLEEIVTIDLVNLAEPPAPAAPPASSPPASAPAEKPAAKPVEPSQPEVKPQPPPKPAIPEKAAPAVEKTPVEEPLPEAISLKPLKKKIKKELPPEPPKKEVKVEKPPDPKVKEQEKQKVKNLAEMIRTEQKAQDEAKKAAAEADRLQKILDAERAQANRLAERMNSSGSSSSTTTQATGTAQSSSVNSALQNQYLSSIAGRLISLWALPDVKKWDNSLVATVVITINKNGEILDKSFEKRSGDKLFDQQVMKTLEEANPLPPIPLALKKERMEIGLNFTPGTITGN